MVDGSGGHEADPGVPVVVVVPVKEGAAVSTCLLDVLEAVGGSRAGT